MAGRGRGRGIHGMPGSLLRNWTALSRPLVVAGLIAACCFPVHAGTASAVAPSGNFAAVPAAAPGPITQNALVTVSVSSMRNLGTAAFLAQPRVRFGFNPIQDGALVTADQDDEFRSSSWTFTQLITPQTASAQGTYPLRIEGRGLFPVPLIGSQTASLDFDRHVCGEPGLGCAQVGIDRPVPDDFALDLTLDLNQDTWVGSGEGNRAGTLNLTGQAGVEQCSDGTAGEALAARVCFTISWQPPPPPQPPSPPTLTVTKESDDHGACTSDDCSLREALLAVPEGGVIVLPHDRYQLTIPRDPADKLGESGHLAITKLDVTIRGTGDPGGAVILQTVPLTRVLEVHGGASGVIENVSIVGGASRAPSDSTAVQGHIHGGGIHNHGSLTLRNVTVSGNRATSTDPNLQNLAARGGGGVYNAGAMNMINVTIAGNESQVLGSGLGGSPSSTTTLRNTLIVNNGGGGTNCTAGLTIVNEGGSLEYPGNSCGSTVPTTASDPLGPLDSATVTYALPAGSEAVDVGPNCPPIDELGTPRPQPGPTGQLLCDSGAIERVNQAPAAAIDAPAGGYTTGEGTPIQLAGRGTDADGDTLTYYWSPGVNLNNPNLANPTFTALDEGQFPLTFAVSDAESTSAPATTAVIVTNVPPVVAFTGFTPANPVRSGGPVTVTASVTDPGVADTVACTLVWNDGSSSSGTVTGSGAIRTCTGSHTYTAAGTYTVTVRVDDGDGGTDRDTATATPLAVYDPEAGSVSGGGQIDSLAGALISAPGSDHVSFSVAARYRTTSSTTPNGSVNWRLPAANFRFSSTSLSWLVVSGSGFQVGGTGEVNRAGTYRFVLTGIDGRLPGGAGDRVRLRVWDPSASDAVIYDSTRDPAATDDIDNARPIPLRAGNLRVR